MTKNQLIADDRVWTTRRVRAPLIWKVEKIEPKVKDSIKNVTVGATRSREVRETSEGEGGFYLPLAA